MRRHHKETVRKQMGPRLSSSLVFAPKLHCENDAYLIDTRPHTLEPETDMAVVATETFRSGTNLRMRVGQAWVGPEHRETMQVINPSNGRPIADVAIATDEDAQSALEAAERAQPGWAASTPLERAAYLKRYAR
jgi:hypothetical protein